MNGYCEFQDFKNFHVMDEESLDSATNYVCLQLNNPSFEYRYYYDMYSYIAKCRIVLQQTTKTRLGEAVCNGKIINFCKILNIRTVHVVLCIITQFFNCFLCKFS